MCIKSVHNYTYTLEFVHDCYETQEMCNEAVESYPSVTQFVPACCKTQKYVIKLLILVFLYLILFLIVIRLKKKCVIKSFTNNFLC